MGIIDDFVKLYEDHREQYQIAAEDVASRIQQHLKSESVLAVVSGRPKRVDSLRDKLKRRNDETPYMDVDSILGDINDLAGVRVLVYFPLDLARIEACLYELFLDVELTRLLRDSSVRHPDTFDRLPGYEAEHYVIDYGMQENRVEMKGCLEPFLVEVQVASMFMHAWSEVEHDLQYKQKLGPLEFDECASLDAVNGLAVSAEVILGMLQQKLALRGAISACRTQPTRLFKEFWENARHQLWVVGPNLYSLVEEAGEVEARMFEAFERNPGLQVRIVVADPESRATKENLRYGPLFYPHLWSAIEVFAYWKRLAAARRFDLKVNVSPSMVRETVFCQDPDCSSGALILRHVPPGSRPKDRPPIRIQKARHPRRFWQVWERCTSLDLRDLPTPEMIDKFWTPSHHPARPDPKYRDA